MICPIRELGYKVIKCLEDGCAWWDSKANFNPETKQYKGQCCILTLSRLKISGEVNTHAY